VLLERKQLDPDFCWRANVPNIEGSVGYYRIAAGFVITNWQASI
jgi:hypothetical protein